ncbi:hypothetical protein FRB90_000836 [Tulasnella sp. 427]|nr:hypothetical protein FRB90_000836 [Tulasnella sp. 427]
MSSQLQLDASTTPRGSGDAKEEAVAVVPQPQSVNNDIDGTREREAERPPSQQSMGTPSDPTELTAIRAHYLKKSLISLQFAKELKVLSNPASNPNVSILSYLGSPFTPPPKDSADVYDLVFFKFIFGQFFLTFPFFASAPKNFFPQKLQPFVDSVLARNLTGGYNATINKKEEDAEELGRQKLIHKLEKQLTLLLGAAVKLTDREEVVRLTQGDLDRLEALARRRRERALKNAQQDVFEVNVIGVRSVVEKKTLRSKAHDEFIIRTRRTGAPDIFVARRFGDFKTLWETLRKAHPEEAIPQPPVKDRSTTMSTAGSAYAPTSPTFETQPISRTPTSASMPTPPPMVRSQTMASTASMSQYRLTREKNRLTLRYYLNSLLNRPAIASSPVLRSFLTAGAIRLKPEELEDAQRREEADRLREEGRKKFEAEVKERVDKLRSATSNIKSDAMGKDGLTHIFSVIRSTSNVKDLPPDFRAVLEWGRVTLASTIFQQLIAADSASETFASLKRLHGLMPYTVMKGILKISNPVGMIRGILDLFTAQPFGGRSLLQRMFTSSLTEEVNALKEDIALVSDKVEDPVLCEKIRQYVYAPSAIQEFYKAEAAETKSNLMTVIMRSPERPSLSRAQMQRVAKCSRAHAQYAKKKEASNYDSEEDEGPSDEDGWLYEDLGVLMRLYGRLRDKEQLIELIFESTTADLLKDIITIFYSPLAQVYKAASIADSLGDLQNFINDLIATVDQVDEGELTSSILRAPCLMIGDENPARTVQTFIDLVQRHEQAFYLFVHKVHSKGEGLFDSLTHWVELFLTFMREGLGQDISLEYLLPHSESERAAIFQEVDAVALYHYKLKVAHEEKVRRRFDGRVKNDADAAEEEAAQDLVDGVIGDLSLGELMQGDIDELSDSSDEYTTSEEESSDDDSSTPSTSGAKLPAAPKHPPNGSSQHHRQHSHPDHKKVLPSLPTQDQPPPPPPKDDLPSPRPSMNVTTSSGSGSAQSNGSIPQRQKTIEALHLKSASGSSGRQRHGAPSTPTPKTPKTPRRKGILAPKEPELHVVPGLLPLFIELVRPQLQPRNPPSN